MIRALIVDDEGLAREALRDLLSEDAEVQVVGECSDGQAAVAAIQKKKPDIVFLDVQMPLLDGFGVIEAVGPGKMPITIFVTAYDAYAVRAFETQALDYVLKPFQEERFRRALLRAKQQCELHQEGSLEQKLSQVIQAARPGSSDRFSIKSAGQIIFIKLSELGWVEARGNYLKLLVGNNSYLIRDTLSNLEQRLDPQRFLRIHRSTIINVDHVKSIKPWYTGDYIVIMEGGKELTASRKYRSHLDKLISSAGHFRGQKGNP